MANPNNLDMFQYLPESILFIIISLLPFQEAARTSILSKQWRTIWYSTKNIQFTERFFIKPEHSDAEKQRRRIGFLHFMQQWIQMHGERTAETFCLSFSRPQNHVYVLKKCIRFAIGRKVKVLDLDFSDPSWYEMGDYYHDSLLHINLGNLGNELQSLKLFSCDFTFPEAKSYNALKSLSLGWIKLSAATLKSLLTECPSLENLSLKKCSDLGHFEISGVPRLKNMVLDKCQIDLEAGFLVNAENLQFFKYLGRFIPFKVEQLRTLEEFALDFRLENERHLVGQIIYNLLSQLWSTKVLSVCGCVLQVIHRAENPLMLVPQLHRVRHLMLRPTALHDLEYFGISFFLCSFPNLEVLSLYVGYPRFIYGIRPPYDREDHPFVSTKRRIFLFECVKYTLRVVEVYDYKGYPCEERVLQYLIKYGRVLENMRIHLATTGHDYTSRAQRLLQVQRASPNLRITII